MEKQNGKQKFIDFAFVKQNADFEQVLGYYNLKVVSRGKQLSVLCPFHDDTQPSLKVTPQTRGFHCFGCGAKGNILDFVRYMEQCDLREAAEILANICRIDLAPPRPPSNGRPRPVRKVQRAETPVEEPIDAEPAPAETGEPPAATHGLPNGPRTDVVAEAINPPLRFALKLDPTHPYLTERVSKEIIEAFGLGLCSKGSMAGRIAIPIHNEQGKLVAYAGRWPGDDGWPEGEDKYKLPTGFQKHHVLFNLDRVLTAEHLVIVEGYFGVFRLYEAGIPAVALMGSSIAPEQVELLKHTKVERISVLLDGDAPGRAAAETVVATLAREFFVRNVVLPDDKQPDDLDVATLHALCG